jgi:hypothetical protein
MSLCHCGADFLSDEDRSDGRRAQRCRNGHLTVYVLAAAEAKALTMLSFDAKGKGGRFAHRKTHVREFRDRDRREVRVISWNKRTREYFQSWWHPRSGEFHEKTGRLDDPGMHGPASSSRMELRRVTPVDLDLEH